MKDRTVTIKMDGDLHDTIKETAAEDFRTQAQQIGYLVKLGLEEREKVRRRELEIRNNQTQIDFNAIDPDPVERGR